MDVTLQATGIAVQTPSPGSADQRTRQAPAPVLVATSVPMQPDLSLKSADAPQPPSQATVQPAVRPAVQQATTQSIVQQTNAKPLGPSDAELKAVAAQVIQALALRSPDAMEFVTDQSTGKTIVRIVDTKTGKLIQQIPSEQMMEIAKSIGTTKGLLLNQKA